MEDETTGREANKTCGVCGDRALGYNFNAVSCESCKAFFRRNALKNKDFRCPFSENCNITAVTRRFCQKCRLDKCFSIGMRKECIMTEEDKILKRKKIEQNRAKKRLPSEPLKVQKFKKENLEDSSIDHESTSLPSVASESYVWESDRRYTDLDGNRQQTTDSLSPVTTASVPSPSSPPEGANIASTKTLDMLTEEIRTPLETGNQNSERYVFQTPPRMESFDATAGFNASSQKFFKFGHSSMNPLGNSDSQVHKHKSSIQQVEKGSSVFPSSLKYELSRFSKNSSNNFQRSDMQNSAAPLSVPSSQNPSAFYPESSTSSRIGSELGQTASEVEMTQGDNVSHKSKETGTKKSNLLTRVLREPRLIVKVFSNPELAAKIFQDQGFVSKIFGDTETISRLVADPQISKFIEENDVTPINETDERQTNSKPRTELGQTLANNGISDNMIRHMLDEERKQVENPILKNLITNRTSAECKSVNGEGNINRDWSQPVQDVARDIPQDVQRTPIAINFIDSILSEAIKLEFSAGSTLGGNPNSRELNDSERAKLNELIVANKALLAPLDDDISSLVGEDCMFKENAGQSDPMLLDVINLTAIAIRRLIKMSKKINSFKNMCQEDQLALLKGGCTEMMILRSAINYDPDKDLWKIPYSQEKMSRIKADVLKEAKGNLYAEHSKFVSTFDPRWRDENIILILSAIALFTPDRPRVIHRDVIKLEQNSYYYLLRRYLESVYPGCEAKSTFLKLIQKISELHRLNDEVVGVYLNVNPSSVEPLLIEIFDLKH